MDNNFEDNVVQPDLTDLVEKYEEAVKTEEKKQEAKTKATPKPKPETKKQDDTIAIFAQGNMYQNKWGEITKGYNIVKKEAADYWLLHRTVRLATPEEVAKHFGVK